MLPAYFRGWSRRGRKPARQVASHPSSARPVVEALETRTLLAALPTVSLLNVPATPLIGQALTLTARFDNTATTDVGFGPYIDLFLPVTGADGAGAATDDGIDFVGASYLGAPVTATQLTLTAGGVRHPYAVDATGAPLVIAPPPGFQPGDKLVVLQLPFGSFTAAQPPADVTVNLSLSQLADLGTPLNLLARGGFQFGNDALDNPATDPTLVGTPVSQSVTPTLFRLTKTYLGPEDETATGPNFPRQYRIDVDIADGQTLTNLRIADLLPDNMQIVSLDGVTGGTVLPPGPGDTPSPATPGGTLARTLDSVTGGPGAADASLTFTFFIPRLDSGAGVIIDATSGDDVTSLNNASTSGDWVPVDARDPATTASIDAPGPEHTLTDKSIAVQKSVAVVTDVGAAGPSPGDTLEWTLNFQISDYFAFQNLVATDLFSDGLTFVPGSATLAVSDGHGSGGATSGSFATGNFTLTANFTGGSDQLVFRVSDELAGRGFSTNGQLVGGGIPAGGTGAGSLPNNPPLPFGATTGTITFRTTIRDDFEIDFPSGDPSVDQGDLLTNDVTIAGDLLAVTDLTSVTGQAEDDASTARVTIVNGVLSKSIYAINGNTGFGAPRIAPGDTVTYRLRYTLPTSDVENLALEDFLPLPVLFANDPDADGTAGPAFTRDTSAAATPPAGQFKFGPADTFFALSGIVPTVAADAGANSLLFTYGDFDDPANSSTELDLLFTVTVSAEPFADGLFLTNQVRVFEGSTNQGDSNQDAIVQIQLTEPVLNVRKGVVATSATGAAFSPGQVGPAGVTFNAPGSATSFTGTVTSDGLAARPIDSNLTGVDAGDLVTFAIVVENTGSGLNGAFDVRFRDTLPAGFVIPAGGLNLQVRDGTGAAMAYTTLGTGLFDPAGGLELDDPGNTNPDPGALDRFDGTSGRNLVVITYDLQVASAAQPNQLLTNTATLFNYAGQEAGPDHTTTDRTDTADVRITNVAPTKSLVATSEAHTTTVAGTERVAIGEVVRYRLVVQVPEGAAPGFQLRDLLPDGLTFLNDGTATAALVANGAGLTSSALSGAGLAQSGSEANLASLTPTFVLPDDAVSDNATTNSDSYGTGTDVFFKFGDLTNDDRDADLEYVVVEFNALVDNSTAGSNDAGDNRDNSFQVLVGGTGLATSNTARVRIAEPSLTVTKSPSATSADAGDTITYTVVYSNATGNDVTTAFDTRLLDTLPASLVLNVGSVVVTPAGAASGVTNNSAGNTIDVLIATIPAGGSVTVTYAATVIDGVTPGQVITNTARGEATSLPGTNGTTTNPTGSSTPGTPGSDTGERTGTGTGPNDLFTTGPADVTIVPLAPVKSLVATSEASSDGTNVTIGEIARFRLVIRVPETNNLNNFQIVEALPTGLTFLNDGTATAALVANGAGLTSSALSGAGLAQSGSEANLASLTPTFVLPAGAISGGPFGTGTDVIFSFGDLVNADRDADFEYVVVELNALVDNTVAGSNDAGDVLSNTFTVQVNGAQSGSPSNAVDLTVVEPNLTTAKRVLSTTGAAVTYEVTVTNAGTATAFDSRVLDTLPASLSLNLASVSVATTGADTGVTNNSAGNTVDFNIVSLAAGSSVTLTYTATLATPGVTITNNAGTVYTSLPGTNGTTANPTGSSTPGTPGSGTGERNGSGGINDYSSGAGTSLGSLGDRVWYDIDGDGVQGAGEPGIPGATVTVRWAGPDGTFDNGDDSVLTTTTGTDGGYLFSGLPVGGQFRVAVDAGTLPNGLTVPTFDRDGTGTPNQTTLTLAAGDPNPRDVDFGYRGPGSLGDRVWYDLQRDGIDAGEPGIGGATVNATWFGFDGVEGTADDLTLSAVTNASGNYGLANLPLGGYRVRVVTATLPLDLVPTYDLDSGLTSPDGVTAVTLTAGTPSVQTADFGFTGRRAVGDRVWYDFNGDGVQGAGEPGIPGVTVTLTWAGPDGDLATAGDNVVLTQTTGADGLYGFVGVPPGLYRVQVTGGVPSGLANTGDPDGTLDATTTLTLGVNDIRTDIDFGYQGANSVAGFVYRDFSVDGLRQPAGANPETGIAGVTLTLTGTDSLGNTFTRTTTTVADGSYSFAGLPDGDYTITETQPPTVFVSGINGFYDGLDTVGTVGGTPTGNSPAKNQLAVTLAGGQGGVEYNFGENPPADPFGFVYIDLNNNGLREAGEPGIPGVTVTVSGTAFAGTPLARPLTGADVPGGSLTVLTDANGRWEFPIIPPGTYSFVETQPAGYDDGLEQDGDPNGPPATVGNDRFDNVALAPFPVRGPFNFGELAVRGSLAGAVYIDTNNNGTRDPGEIGIPGVVVTLTGQDVTGQAVAARVVTDVNGNYAFVRLRPGTYSVAESHPVNFLDGRDTAGTLGGAAGNDVIDGAFIAANQAGVNYNFGELGLTPEFLSKLLYLGSTSPSDWWPAPPGLGFNVVNPAPLPGAFAGMTSAQYLVNRLYLDLLGRGADPGGLAFYSGALDRGTGRDQVVASLLASNEYRTRVVQGLYNQLLGRAADPSGLSYFVGLLGAGATRDQAAALIAGSAEYFQSNGGTNAGFLAALYQDLLGRPIDPTGQAGFTAMLQAGASRAQVAAALVNSREYRERLVQGLYQQLLRRPADPGGLAYFTGLLQAGGRDLDVITALASSFEYLNA